LYLDAHPQALAVVDAVSRVGLSGATVSFEFPTSRRWVIPAGEEVRDQLEAALTLTLGRRSLLNLSFEVEAVRALRPRTREAAASWNRDEAELIVAAET
jgi:hypothetical protein